MELMQINMHKCKASAALFVDKMAKMQNAICLIHCFKDKPRCLGNLSIHCAKGNVRALIATSKSTPVWFDVANSSAVFL